MNIAAPIALVALSLFFTGNIHAASGQGGTPPVHCPSQVSCNPFQLTYYYSKTLDVCPSGHENLYECGVPLPPINVECLPSAYQVMQCHFDPEGVNVSLTHSWFIDSYNAYINDAGRMRCNAGELVTVSVNVSNGYSSGTGYTEVVCPGSAN